MTTTETTSPRGMASEGLRPRSSPAPALLRIAMQETLKPELGRGARHGSACNEENTREHSLRIQKSTPCVP